MKKQTIFVLIGALALVLIGVFAGSYFSKPKTGAGQLENAVSITQGVEVVQTDSAGWVLRETNVIRLEKLNLDGRIAEVKKLISDQAKAIDQAQQIRANAQKQLEILQQIKIETGEE